MFLESKWWAFCIVALFIFIGCVVMNYILKKMNEARIEERCSRLLQKSFVSTQLQEPNLEMESVKPKPSTANTDSNNGTQLTGISLVFNRQENMLLGVKKQASTLLAKKNKSWNMEEILEASQDEEDSLYHKISIISVIKNKSNQVAKSIATKTRSIIIKDDEVCVSHNSCSRLPITAKESLVQKISSGSLKLVKSDRKINLAAYKLDSYKHKNNADGGNTDNHIFVESKIPATKADQINVISQKIDDITVLDNVVAEKDENDDSTKNMQKIKSQMSKEASSSSLTTHRLEAKSANTVINSYLQCNKSHEAGHKFSSITFNTSLQQYDSEPTRSNLVDVLKRSMCEHVNSLTKSESHIVDKSKETMSKLNSTVNKLEDRKPNNVCLNNTDDHDFIEANITTLMEENYKHLLYTQETIEMLSQIISSNFLTTHKLEAKTGKAHLQGISNNIVNSELEILEECHKSNNAGETSVFLPDKSNQVSILKHSMWHPNNCLNKSESHTPCNLEEKIHRSTIDTGETSNTVIVLKDEDQKSYISTNFQHKSYDLLTNIHKINSHEMNIDSTNNKCSDSRIYAKENNVAVFDKNTNDNDSSNNRSSSTEHKLLDSNNEKPHTP